VIRLGAASWEGNGDYSIEVITYPRSDEFRCPAGTSAATSFTMDIHLEAKIVGAPLLIGDGDRHDDDVHGWEFQQAGEAPGATILDKVEYECARDAQIAPDGSIAGATPTESSRDGRFPGFASDTKLKGQPGNWTCVGRGSLEDDADGQTDFTPWTPPLTALVREYFAPKTYHIVDNRGPTFGLTLNLPDTLASRGRFELRMRRFNGTRLVGRTRVVRGRVKGRGLRMNFRIPKKQCWRGVMAFKGTRLVAPGSFAFQAYWDKRKLNLFPSPLRCR
jgi:hypothetical protein